MLVSEVMTTNPTCCIPSDTAQTAAIIMRDENTGIVPIVEQKGSGKLVGVVTDRDLCIGIIAQRPPGTESLNPTNIPVEHCMTTKVIYCSPSDDVETVLDLMKDNQVRRILVVRRAKHNSGRRFDGGSDEPRTRLKGRYTRDA